MPVNCEQMHKMSKKSQERYVETPKKNAEHISSMCPRLSLLAARTVSCPSLSDVEAQQSICDETEYSARSSPRSIPDDLYRYIRRKNKAQRGTLA